MIASAFNKSVELINLTVTVYMILQGICKSHIYSHELGTLLCLPAPMFWGTLADRWGRRPMFLACMLVLSLSCVGLALVPTNAYWLLMVLRCVQAAGSASTIALGESSIRCTEICFIDAATPVRRRCDRRCCCPARARGLLWPVEHRAYGKPGSFDDFL